MNRKIDAVCAMTLERLKKLEDSLTLQIDGIEFGREMCSANRYAALLWLHKAVTDEIKRRELPFRGRGGYLN